jgi:anti-sigma factor RsiW
VAPSDNTSTPRTPRQASSLLIHAYLDGELDAARSLEVQSQIEADPQFAAQASNITTLKKLLSDHVEPEPLSPALQSRIRASIQGSQRPSPRRPTWMALAASVVLAALASSGATWLFARSEREATPVVEVADAHLRSLVAERPFDIASSERHVVRPWFAGKLPYAPKVADLSSEGFPLVGARVDVVDTSPVAALVFQRRRHVISLFSRPTTKSPSENIHQRSLKGYNIVSWADGGNEYWAISDLNAAELKSFAELFQKAR